MREIARTAAALFVLFVACRMHAQDAEWLSAWQEAQRQRPRAITSTARLAQPGEPGTPLVIHGRVYRQDGVTPAAGVLVFAYHTDSAGVYNRPRASGWRLRGWARTDAKGQFEFHTIRPAPYPGSRTAAHVHFTIEGAGLQRRWTPELNFEGDAFLTAKARRESRQAGQFGSIRPVTTRNRVQHVTFNIRITNEGRF